MLEMHTEEAQLASRRKRVQRLKKIIIVTLITGIIVPTVLCIFLFIRTAELERQIEELKLFIEETKEDIPDEEDHIKEKDITDHNDEINNEDAARDVAAIQPEMPETQLQMESENAGSGEENAESVKMRNVYLTFDDGPSIYTGEILDILKEYDVKATFFVVGKEGEMYEDLYKRIVEEGHTLGMHSYSHRYNEIYASEENFAEDFERLQTYLYDITGVESRFYRFPGGSSNTVSKIDMSNFIEYLSDQKVVYFDWNVSSGDASSGGISVEQIIDNCVGNVDYYNNMVILMHDSQEKETTVEALPGVIEKLLAYDNTQIVPITDDTEPVQHRKR